MRWMHDTIRTLRKPMPIMDLQIIPDGVWSGVGPIYFHYEWTPVTTDIYGNTLVVDHYDLYSSVNAGAPFPGNWSYFNSYPASPTPSLPHTNLHKVFVLFVAVDADGFIVASTPGADVPVIRADDLRKLSQPSGSAIGLEADSQLD